jgi:hypothetical protein
LSNTWSFIPAHSIFCCPHSIVFAFFKVGLARCQVPCSLVDLIPLMASFHRGRVEDFCKSGNHMVKNVFSWYG